MTGTPDRPDRVDWERTVFVLLPPDAIARHLAVPILDRLAEHGFVPQCHRVLWRRPPDLDAFHERNITSVWKAYLYRLVDLVFAFGPTVAMLVRDTGEGAEPSHVRLRRLKGASDPAEAAPGTIRGDFRAINVMLGLVHTADSPADSEHEQQVFFGDDRPAPGDAGDLRELTAMLASAYPREERGYDAVLGGVRARLVAAVWDDLRPEGRALAASWRAGDPTGLARPKAGHRLATLLHTGLDHPLAPVLACEFHAGEPTVDLRSVRHLLAAHGIALDPWEELVLTTSMAFPPLRSR